MFHESLFYLSINILFVSSRIPVNSGGFKSQQCHQLLTGPPILQAPTKKKKREEKEKSLKQLGQRAPVALA